MEENQKGKAPGAVEKPSAGLFGFSWRLQVPQGINNGFPQSKSSSQL